MVHKYILAAFGAACIAISSASAGEIMITQEKKAFSEKKLTVKAGDTVVFRNDDQVTHNVYSRSKGHKFDIGAQKPGVSTPYTFASPGKVKVRCAIHPRMKLTVHVE